MSEVSAQAPLVVIVGPTASGKSTLGVWLAEQLNGEVVACDSTQLYRGFDIGTAKPDVAERRGIPHHLIDVLEPDEEATAGNYRERALLVLADLQSRKKLPIFTVGTGLYLRALLEGFADVPLRSEEIRARLRETVESHPPDYLHRILRKLDLESAAKIAVQDEQKLIRAVEVCLLTKKTLSEVHRQGRNPLRGWRVLKIGLQPEREQLVQRIHSRTDVMLGRGWMGEVQSLLATGLPETAKPFQFIGYRELRDALRGTLPLAQARFVIQQSTRQYAKRQLTWFRKEPQVRWLAGFGDEPQIQSEALQFIRSEMGNG